jgi:hypothetical protein
MRNKLWTLAATLALLAVLGNYYAKPVLAQVRAALTKNIDEKGRVPYMQQVFLDCVVGSNFCDFNFPAVPAGKRLVIEHVSANISTQAAFGVNATFLIAPGGAFSLPGRTMASPQVIGVNEPVLAYFEAGESPLYRVVYNSPLNFGFMTAVLSGYMVDLTQ